MTSTNWKEIVHEGIVKYMPANAQFKNGVPNIAAITRAGILADNSGEYNNPRVFTNEEIQRQVGLIHEGGTPIACVRWYRNNPGQRKTTARAGFKEAYALFKEQGKSISEADLAKIAEANLHVIFGARGSDLSVLSTYGIMENFKTAMEEKKKLSMEEKLAKARAAKEAKQKKAEAKTETKAEAIETSEAPTTATVNEPKLPKKSKLKRNRLNSSYS